MAVQQGEELKYEFLNLAARELFGRRDLAGKRPADAFPEAERFPELDRWFQEVTSTSRSGSRR
jgi:hypothetical protein